MKKDIPNPKVKDVAIAIIPEEGETGETFWYVYLVNLNNKPLDTVIIVSKGYGEIDGRKIKTSTLRHLFKEVKGNDFVKVELIEEKLFGISNEFWISFWLDEIMHDKKYVFVRDSISPGNFTKIPILEKTGVMIK